MTVLTPDLRTHDADRRGIGRAPRGAGACLGCALIVLAAQVPLLIKFFVDLWSRPQYAFFPFLLAAVPFIAVACLRDMPAGSTRPGRTAVGLELWAMALACLLVGGVMYLKWFAPVSTWLFLAGAVWLIGGATLARALWPVGVLLLLVLPPPGQYDGDLLVTLRQMAVTCGGRLLTLLGVPQYVHGAVIDVPGGRLMVEEACSGINSMLAVLAFTVLLAFWKRLPVWSLGVLLPAAFTFVFWANVGRIVLCAAAKVGWGINLLVGAPHELLGIGIFVVCMALVFSTERLGQAVFDWDDTGQTPAAAAPSATKVAPSPRLWVWPVAAVAFACVGGFVAVRTWHAWPASALPEASAFRMPDTLAGWQRVGDADLAPERAEVSGRQSRLWQYRRGAMLATVGIDYPFDGYHDATICYSLAGWQMAAMRESVPPADGPARFDVTMARPPLSHGLVSFALCDETGRWWRRPEPVAVEGRIAQALRLSRKKALSPPLAQLQVLHVDFDTAGDDERRRLAELFDAAADAISAQVRGFHAAGR